MRKLFLMACGLFLLIQASVFAQELDQLASIKLVDAVSRDTISLIDYSKEALIVVIFTSNYCPYSRKYETRIKALHETYKDQGVQLFLVNPNKGNNDNLEEMQLKATQEQYDFPYLSDKEQQLTQLLGANRTPEAFLIEKNALQLLYHGAIDDNPQSAEYVEYSYLKLSIEQAIIGETPADQHHKVIGCMIKKGS